MLRSLSGRAHQVVTGVTLILPAHHRLSSRAPIAEGELAVDADAPIIETFSVSASVNFTPLSDEMIRLYIESGEPFDKAGGYGMQGLAATFVTDIVGCYYAVLGFPLHEIAKRLTPHLDLLLSE
jgi:septum formation protein